MSRPKGEPKKAVIVGFTETELELIRAAAYADRAKSVNQWIVTAAIALAKATPSASSPNTPLSRLQAEIE